MRIAFCTIKSVSFGGGIEKYTFELGRRLVARGHEVTVYCMRHYGPVPDSYGGMRVVGVPCVPIRAAEKITASLTSAVATALDRDVDIVHFHTEAPGSFAWIPRWLGRHKCVLQFHGLGWKRSRWGAAGVAVHKILEQAAVRQNHAYTAVSRAQCDYFRDRYGLSVTYIPTGAEIKPPAPVREVRKFGLTAGSYVLFASRLVREKGLHYLIPAFRRLATSRKLVIAGDVSDPAYEQELRALAGDDSRILFLGFVTGRPLDELFDNARIYVQPSEIEGLSIALLEAMSYGNCCLVSDIPANLEAIDGAGWQFESKSVASLHDRLDWLLGHPDQAGATGQRARARVAEHYSWDGIADQFEQLYAGLLCSVAA